MNFEKLHSPEMEPIVVIKKSIDAPLNVKENPFYDPEIWGRANSPDDIYLPDSDEAISFALAAHEIGHLVDKGKVYNASLDNFEGTRAEEERAWNLGWDYLEKHLVDYYNEGVDRSPEIKESFNRIKSLLMRATDLSKDMYLTEGALDNATTGDYQSILKNKREEFFRKNGQEFKNIFSKIKDEKIGLKPDWDKFIKIVEKAVKDIIFDNRASIED